MKEQDLISFTSDRELRNAMIEEGLQLEFNKGETIVREGEFVKVLPIVISGQIRVFQTGEDREILLYHVDSFQTCMMSLSACFYNHKSPSKAVTTTDTKVLAIPTRFITKWQKEFPAWNNFVITTFRNRYDELLSAFESVAFNRMDKRIENYLNERCREKGSNTVELSHLQLSNELGTTRVVVSRILKQFELEGKVLLHRGSIEVL